MKDESIDYDLHKLKLNYTSFIYVNGEGDDPDNPVEYQALYSGENRVWVDYAEIPEYKMCIRDSPFASALNLSRMSLFTPEIISEDVWGCLLYTSRCV